MLGAPRSILILLSLAEGEKGLKELRRDSGVPAQSTLRNHLRTVEASGAVKKRRKDAFPGTFEYMLTDCGRELLTVAESLERWLAWAPRGPLELGTDASRAAVKGLVDGWLAQMLAPLATEPLSLTELDRHLTTVSYPTLERRLEAMVLAEQLDAGVRTSHGTPYAMTTWLRRSIAPLAMAARWEHRIGLEGADPLTHRELESAFKIAGPLLDLPSLLSGICQVSLRSPADGSQRLLGKIEVNDGEIAFGGVYPERKPDAWASGTLDSWFSAVLDADTSGLRRSGDCDLVETILSQTHRALFKQAAPAASKSRVI